jgi:hypothetical protein
MQNLASTADSKPHLSHSLLSVLIALEWKGALVREFKGGFY